MHTICVCFLSQVGILKPHPAFTHLLETAAEPTLTFETTEVPMLCPPLPWTSLHSGAYLLSSTKLMRATEGTTQHQRLLEQCPPAQLHGPLDALTQLGNCAWRVNGHLLDLVLQIFRDKGCMPLGVPPPRSEAPRPARYQLPPGSTPVHKSELRKELARCLKVAREMHSLRSEALYRLSLAQHLRHRVFWLPHNMDFRGRTYPCPPHFNHLGSDLARALLEFAEGRPLGPRGLDWLKIHLINLTGLKKGDSLRMRLAFADEVMEEILDSADNPLTVWSHELLSLAALISASCLSLALPACHPLRLGPPPSYAFNPSPQLSASFLPTVSPLSATSGSLAQQQLPAITRAAFLIPLHHTCLPSVPTSLCSTELPRLACADSIPMDPTLQRAGSGGWKLMSPGRPWPAAWRWHTQSGPQTLLPTFPTCQFTRWARKWTAHG